MKKTRKFNQARFPSRRRLLPVLIGELLAVGALGTAHAATINVAANQVYINDNGVCSLIEAMDNAEGGSVHDDCTAGDRFGPDTLNLAANSTYLLTVLIEALDGNNGLPTVESKITINGNGSTIERDDTASSFRLFHVSSTGNLTLNNLTLQNGAAIGSSNNRGGAVFNLGILTAVNSTFFQNSATTSGGAIRNGGSGIVSITNSTLSENSVGSTGGALFNDGANVTLINSTVSGNSASSGGGVFNDSTSQHTLTITNSTLTDNTATVWGGGLYNRSGATATLKNSTFTFNSTTSSFGGGGGIYNWGNLTVINSTLAGNNTANDGGGLMNGRTAIVTNSTLSGNAASDVGGAIVNGSSDTLTLTNVTVANNVAVSGGSGLWSGTNDIITMNNTIIAQSAGGDNCVGFLDSSPSSNLFDDLTCGGAQSTSIQLNPVLRDNGGPTLTHALLANSSAINAGDAAVCASDPILRFFDQRGFVRVNRCDIGAFERNARNSYRIGVKRGKRWFLDTNGNGKWNGNVDRTLVFGFASDKPVVGDWNGDGFTEIGVKRGNKWYLDYNGSGAWEGSQDRVYTFGWPSDQPIAGDWDGDGTTEIGVKRGNKWYLDYNGNGTWNSGDRAYTFGWPSDQGVVGDWDGDNADEIGVRRGRKWYLDANGNGVWNGGKTDQVATFGNPGDQPLAGDWNDDGFAGVGVKRGRNWYLDRNANDKWDNCTLDTCIFNWGLANDVPVSGRWKP